MRMMQARLCIEPALAREAAVHATAEAMAAISATTKRARAAASWAEYEAQDDLFHRAVAEASDNALLLSFFDQLNRVRRGVTWGAVERRNARPPADHSSFGEHEAVLDAIVARAPDRAQRAMRDHLKSVSARLFP
jgi:DNA-binding FadR family transcriptional regulator